LAVPVKIYIMKIVGIIIIAVGILMLVFRSFNFTQTKKVVDLGPVQIDKKENKTVQWPIYGGVIAIVAGIALVAVGSKSKNA
jgi:uncharacterized membrane protein YidH (DUF202 family)